VKKQSDIINKLKQFIKKYYTNQIIKGGILSLFILLLFFIFISLLEFYMNFDVGLRTILFWSYLIINSLIIIRFILLPLLKLFNIRKGITYKDAAKILGHHFNEIDDKLINILELSEMGLDNELINASIDQKTKSITPIPFKNAIQLKSNFKIAKWLLAPLAFILIFVISGKADMLIKSSSRIIKHNKFFEPKAPYIIKIESELTTKQQEDYILKIKIEGNEIPKEFYVSVDSYKFIMKKKNSTEFEYLFKNINKKKDFNLIGGGYKSKKYYINVIPKPTITDVKTTINYPKYIQKKDIIVNSIEDLRVPEGTQIEWVVNFENTDTLILKINSETTKFNIKNTHTYKQKYYTPTTIDLINYNKYNLRDTGFKIDIINDEKPLIIVNEIKDSINNYRNLSGEIRDDYGLSKLNFCYKIYNEDTVIKFKEQLKISSNKDQVFYHEFNITKLKLKQGEEVRYYFEVWDNDKINGHKKTKSLEFKFTEKTRAETIIEKDGGNEKIKNSLSNSISKAQELKEEIKEFNKEIIAKKKLGWEEKQKTKEILEKQKKILEEIKRNQSRNEDNHKNQKKINPSTLEKQKQLKKLMDNVVDEEMKKLLEELEKLMNKKDKEKLKDLLKKINSKNNDLEKELDRELELFKQLEFEQKTEELIQEIKKLREEQANLKNETDSAKKETKDLAKKQEKLQEKMKKVKESIKDLDKKNEELENKNSLPKTKEDEKEIENSMKKSKESLDKKDNKKSSKSQKKSLEKLDELADKLSDMQQSNSEEKQIENIETLREILENLLNLSFSQEDLINKTRKTKTSSSEFIKLVQIQKKLSDDSKIIEDSLFALSKRVVQIQEKINSEISLIKENMIESTKKLEERVIKKSTEKQQFVMTSTNNLALLLSEILKNMQLDLSKMPSKCKKPKNCNNPQKCNNPSMSELKKAQKELNEKMKKGKGKGKGKGGKGEMTSKKLMELAKKQGLIKSGLESLEKENGELGNSKMLDKIKEQMEENEYDIINNNISNKTFERLDKIIDKFIDFEKAEKEKGEDEKRESNEWILDESKIDKKYSIVKKKQKSQLELRSTTPVNLSPFFKNEVNKYFNSIIKENND
jgi:hypothetical protein